MHVEQTYLRDRGILNISKALFGTVLLVTEARKFLAASSLPLAASLPCSGHPHFPCGLGMMLAGAQISNQLYL